MTNVDAETAAEKAALEGTKLLIKKSMCKQSEM